MREFMTRVSDYFNERRNDPERKEDRLAIGVVAAVAVVIIVLLLLLLWGHTTQEKKKQEAAEKAQALQEAQEMQEEQALATATYEEKMAEYMSKNSGEELRQEYLNSTSDLAEKVRELQTTMERVEKELDKVIIEYREGSAVPGERLTALEKEIRTVIESVRGLEARYADLSDVIQTIDRERIPMIQAQIKGFQEELQRVYADVGTVYEKIAALEKEDRKLWEKLSEVERGLDTALSKNLSEIDRQIERMDGEMNRLEKEMKEVVRQMNEKLEERIDTLSEEGLSYRYEQSTNTLYLMPNREKAAGKEAQP